MRIINEAMSFLWYEKARTTVAVIQLTFFISAISISFGVLCTTNKYINTVEMYNLEDKIFLVGNNYMQTDSMQESKPNKTFKNISCNFAETCILFSKDKTKSTCILYEKQVYKNTVNNFYRGRAPQNPNECVISYDMHTLYNYTIGTTLILHDTENLTYKLTVSGILEENTEILSNTISGSELTLKVVFFIPSNTIITFNKPISTQETALSMQQSKNGIVSINKDSSYHSATKELKELNYSYFSFSDMTNIEKQENYEIATSFSFLSILLFVIGITGIGVNNFLVFNINKHLLSVYYICGMSQAKCFSILFTRNLIIVFLSSVLSFFSVALLRISGFLSDFYVSNLHILILSLLCIVILLCSSIPLYIDIKNHNPVAFQGGA